MISDLDESLKLQTGCVYPGYQSAPKVLQVGIIIPGWYQTLVIPLNYRRVAYTLDINQLLKYYKWVTNPCVTPDLDNFFELQASCVHPGYQSAPKIPQAGLIHPWWYQPLVSPLNYKQDVYSLDDINPQSTLRVRPQQNHQSSTSSTPYAVNTFSKSSIKWYIFPQES